MEVGCLKYPGASTIGSQPLDWNNAPMTGTTAQPSHEPLHQRKGTGTRHTEKTSVEKNPTSLGGGREGKKMADRTQHEGKTERAKESHDRCSQPPGMRMPKTADLGTQALLVVNSFKLHLNAFIFRFKYSGLPRSVKSQRKTNIFKGRKSQGMFWKVTENLWYCQSQWKVSEFCFPVYSSEAFLKILKCIFFRKRWKVCCKASKVITLPLYTWHM